MIEHGGKKTGTQIPVSLPIDSLCNTICRPIGPGGNDRSDRRLRRIWSCAGSGGKKTLADFGVKLLADVKLGEIIPYVATAMGWLFGVNAQRLRRNTTARSTNRIRELEQ